MVRNALLIWSGRKKPPPTIRNAGKTTDGTPFDFGPGFVPLIRRTVRHEKEIDGNKVVQMITPGDRSTAAAQAAHLRLQYGDEVRVTKIAAKSERVPPVEFNLTIGGPEALRGVAKSLFNLAAVVLPREVIKSAAFDEARSAIRHGTEPLPVGHDYVNAFPVWTRIGDFDHALHVVCDPTSRTVRGYATLFGHFKFSATLARNIDLRASSSTLVQDPLTRTSTKTQSDDAGALAFVERTPDALKKEFSEASAGMTDAFRSVMQAVTKAAPQRVAANLADDLVARLAAAREDERDAVIAEFSEKAACIVSGLPFEEMLDPKEFGF
ncbi:MAG: hypothetical protein ACRELY_26425 [Polyangiaceae bacterium]